MPRLDKRYIRSLKKDALSYAEKRRHVIKDAGDALHHAKRAIFAMHKGDMKEAEKKISSSGALLRALLRKYKSAQRIASEGAFRAGLEEYVEAVLFHQFLTTGKIGKVTTLPVDGESYIAGLCDVPGELYRYAIQAATAKDLATVKKCATMAQEITGELIEFNLTKYLRNKFDQAKNAVQKIEKIIYDLSLRG